MDGQSGILQWMDHFMHIQHCLHFSGIFLLMNVYHGMTLSNETHLQNRVVLFCFISKILSKRWVSNVWLSLKAPGIQTHQESLLFDHINAITKPIGTLLQPYFQHLRTNLLSGNLIEFWLALKATLSETLQTYNHCGVLVLGSGSRQKINWVWTYEERAMLVPHTSTASCKKVKWRTWVMVPLFPWEAEGDMIYNDSGAKVTTQLWQDFSINAGANVVYYVIGSFTRKHETG